MGKQFSFSAGGVVLVLLVLLGLATPAFSLKVNTTLNVSACLGILLLCSKGNILKLFFGFVWGAQAGIFF
jgi:hypothetical protein